MRSVYPKNGLLIVSNSAGTNSDSGQLDAKALQRNTGVNVLIHRTKKPGCSGEVYGHFQSCPDSGIEHAGQIAVIGDRLLTDVVMANLMGSWSIWIRDGVIPNNGLVSGFHPKYLLAI